jgi:DNA-binding NarL/FixJ family response regulator
MRNLQQDWHSLLTPRELEIARLVARGLSNKEIAQMLGTSPGTVKIQVHWVFQKLGVSKRGDLGFAAQGLSAKEVPPAEAETPSEERCEG